MESKKVRGDGGGDEVMDGKRGGRRKMERREVEE